MQMDKSSQCSNLRKMLNNLITINQCDVKDLKEIISLGRGFKSGQKKESLRNKTAVLLFDKPSLRTKLSFMIGVEKLGGNAIRPCEPGTELKQIRIELNRTELN